MEGDDESLAHLGAKIGISCTRGFKQKSTPCQDDYCIIAAGTSCFIGVFDGHGEMGHYLANGAQACVTGMVQENFEMYEKDTEAAFKDLIKKTDQTCKDIPGSDDSGATGTWSMITPEKITVAWLGDSHAKVGRLRKRIDPASSLGARAEWILQPMTKAHRPSDMEEMRRIQDAGGRVDDPDDPRLEARVYAMDHSGPGLAMSRSLGDLWGHRLGVSSEPDFKIVPTKGLEFFCVGSDGIWDMLSDDEVATIIGTAGRDQPQVAADQIKGLAWERWCEKSGDTYVDDISCFVLWLPFSC
jgi:serine/threonine protein phosphatase PrpC